MRAACRAIAQPASAGKCRLWPAGPQCQVSGDAAIEPTAACCPQWACVKCQQHQISPACRPAMQGPGGLLPLHAGLATSPPCHAPLLEATLLTAPYILPYWPLRQRLHNFILPPVHFTGAPHAWQRAAALYRPSCKSQAQNNILLASISNKNTETGPASPGPWKHLHAHAAATRARRARAHVPSSARMSERGTSSSSLTSSYSVS